ncbi:hypothetical protein GFB49_15185 [Epibacterium sp. SM1979]|uniref:Uncharacterized protein n=1 Tax=Tritonibacter litoralis TaxID=2662264 RepID=A0A843YJ24_9RHOB|nr:hypothetical protein [Tritonibacter litoralis]MQQ09808.1 hypothetical protein [Tritonibacter litoralis]
MDKLWISALVGALTGGFTSSICVVVFSMPLWSLMVIYPLIGLATFGVIYGLWRHLEAPSIQPQDGFGDKLVYADLLLK